MKVIAFEGTWPAGTAVTWGAAALEDGDYLLNPTTGLRVPLAEANTYVRDGHLTSLPHAIPIRSDYAWSPLILVAITRDNEFAQSLIADTGKLGGLVGHKHHEAQQYYVFRDEDAFGAYRRDRIGHLIERALYASPDTRPADAVSVGLLLDPGHPQLNALRVHFAEGDKALARRLARASVRPAESLADFDEFLEACESKAPQYRLKYERGATVGGGLNVDVAAATLQNLSSTHRLLEPHLLSRFPFFAQMRPPRFSEMRTGSAELVFSTDVEQEHLGDKVSRFLELKWMESLLRGETRGIAVTEPLANALGSIIRPTADTILKQRPLGRDIEEEVFPDERPHVEGETSREFTVLGFQSGLWKVAEEIELLIAPSRRLRISAKSDGRGGAPEGIDYLQTQADFLFRPMLFTMYRQCAGDTETFFLIRASELRPGTSEATAIPSSIVPGAMLTGLKFPLERVGDALKTPQGEVPGLSRHGLSGARKWLDVYAQRCREHEIRWAGHRVGTWLTPIDPPAPSALDRTVVALHFLGGSAPVSDLVGEVNRRFNTQVRVNNTRREVHSHSDLLEFLPGDKKAVRLTLRGNAYANVFIAAGGLCERKRPTSR